MCHGDIQLWTSPLDSGKSPTRAPARARRRSHGSGRGFPAAGATTSASGEAAPRRRGAGGAAHGLLGSALGAGLRLATTGIHLPGPARRFLAEQRRGLGRRRAQIGAPSAPASLAPPGEARSSRRPQIARRAPARREPCVHPQLCGRRGRGSRVRVRVCLSPAASWGQQWKGGRRERQPRRTATREAEASRGAGSGDLNSAGAVPRARLSVAAFTLPAAAGTRVRIAIPFACRAVAAVSADRGAAAVAAASPARAGPLSAGAGGWRQKGRVVALDLGAFPAPALRRWPCPGRPVRVSNNGAERRREPRARPAAVEEVAGLPARWAGRRPPPLARWSLPACPASPAPTPGIPWDHRRSSIPRVWCQRPG